MLLPFRSVEFRKMLPEYVKVMLPLAMTHDMMLPFPSLEFRNVNNRAMMHVSSPKFCFVLGSSEEKT
jgi:hypothetical protein